MSYQTHESRANHAMYRLFQRILSLAFKWLGKLESHGNKNIPRKGGVLLVSNHVSYLDPLIIGTLVNRELHYMVRHDVFLIPGLGKLITMFNGFPVRRSTADRAALKRTTNLLKEGNAVLIFPEGTRSLDGVLGKARDGAGFIAYSTGVPTIPVFIRGSEQMMPRGSKWPRPAKLSVIFGPPIDFTEVQRNADRLQLYWHRMSERMMQAIGSLREVNVKAENRLQSISNRL